MKPQDLLPCPFCGQQLSTWESPSGQVVDALHEGYGCCLAGKRLDYYDLARWNRRSPAQKLAADDILVEIQRRIEAFDSPAAEWFLQGLADWIAQRPAQAP